MGSKKRAHEIRETKEHTVPGVAGDPWCPVRRPGERRKIHTRGGMDTQGGSFQMKQQTQPAGAWKPASPQCG